MIGPFPDSPHHRLSCHPVLRTGVVVHPDDDDPLLRAYFPEGGGGDGERGPPGGDGGAGEDAVAGRPLDEDA